MSDFVQNLLCSGCNGKATWREGMRDMTCVVCSGIGWVLVNGSMIPMTDSGLLSSLPQMPPPEVAPPPTSATPGIPPAAEDIAAIQLSSLPAMPPPEVAPPPASATPGAPPAAEDIAAIQTAELHSIASAVNYAISVQRPETAAALLEGNKEVENRAFRMDAQWVAIHVGPAVTAAENETCAVQAASREDVSSYSEGCVHGLIFFQGSKRSEHLDDASPDEVGPICNYRRKWLRFQPVEVAGGSEGKWVLSKSSCDSIRKAILAGPTAAFGFKSGDGFSGSHISLQPQQATPQQEPSEIVPESFTTSICPVTELLQDLFRSAADEPGSRTTHVYHNVRNPKEGKLMYIYIYIHYTHVRATART